MPLSLTYRVRLAWLDRSILSTHRDITLSRNAGRTLGSLSIDQHYGKPDSHPTTAVVDFVEHIKPPIFNPHPPAFLPPRVTPCPSPPSKRDKKGSVIKFRQAQNRCRIICRSYLIAPAPPR